MAASQMSCCTVYSGDGETRSLPSLPCGHATPRSPPAVRTIAASVPVVDIMSRDVVCAGADLPVAAVARLINDNHIGCIPVIDHRGYPVGMVTKTDLVDQLATRDQRVNDIMMPLALTLDERATVSDAATMMVLEDLHHVMIVSCSRTLLGVVSSKDIVRWLIENDRSSPF